MKRFGSWVNTRRKKLGFETQQAFSQSSGLALSTVQSIESTGDISKRERGIKKLLALGLRVSEEGLERLAKGEIEDAPIEGRDSVLQEFMNVAASGGGEVVGMVPPTAALRIARAFIDRAIAGEVMPKYPTGTAFPDPKPPTASTPPAASHQVHHQKK